MKCFKEQLALHEAMLSLRPRAVAIAERSFGYHGKLAYKSDAFSVLAAASNPTSITNDADLADSRRGFKLALLSAAAAQEDPLEAVAHEVASDRSVETHIGAGDLPEMEIWDGNDRSMSPLSINSIDITNLKWSSALRVKNDDIRNDSIGLLPGQVAAMGEQAALQPSHLIAKMLINGFGDDTYPELGLGQSFDGDFFFSDSHATGSNLLSGSEAAFSVANLKIAIMTLRAQKRFDGGDLYCKPTHLIVGPDLEQDAEAALTSTYLGAILGRAATNSSRSKLDIIVSPIIPTGTWFVADLSGAVRPLIFQNREALTVQTVGGPDMSDYVGFAYDEFWIGAFARNNAGYWDWRRIIGSQGS